MKLGSGPIVTRGPNINARLFELLVKAAEEEGLPVQLQAEPRGTGTDANVIQLNRSGVATGLVAMPNRYMHTPGEVVSLKDVDACIKLLACTVARITPETSFIPF
jgi:endoglucanase